MRAAPQRQKPIVSEKSAGFAKPDLLSPAQSNEAQTVPPGERLSGKRVDKPLQHVKCETCEDSSPAGTSPRLAYDFGHIPVYAAAQPEFQSRLTINTPGDVYEQEADRVAKLVMQRPDTYQQHASDGQHPGRLEEPLHPSSSSGSDSHQEIAPPDVHEALRSPGQPLDGMTRALFEHRFGRDFSGVQIHTGSKASDSAKYVNAVAYTVGQHIVFGAGAYRPSLASGRQIIAHELSHVLQQRGSTSGVTQVQRLLTPTPWTPPVRADELGPGRTDRLGNRTFDLGMFSIFVPAGAASVTANHIHVFFSPGGVTGPSGGNAVAVHGLRSAADSSHWILISVPGVPGGANTISDADIIACLQGVGRAAHIDSVRLSAHSRGAAGLAATLRRRAITPSLIEHVTILDATDHESGLTTGLQRSGMRPDQVTAYNVIFGRFSPYSVRSGGSARPVENIRVDPTCIRSVGYARLILDGVATGRAPTPLPHGIDTRVHALTLHPRGSFSSRTPPPPGKISFDTFCADPANQAALTAMRDGEPSHPTGNLSWAEKARRAPDSPYAFIEHNNVMGFNDPSIPRSQWYSFNPQIYRHHLFVAEFAHELF